MHHTHRQATLATRRESRGKALLGSADSLSLEELTDATRPQII